MFDEKSLFHKAEHHFFSLVSFDNLYNGDISAFLTGVKASGLNPAFIRKIDDAFLKSIEDCTIWYEKNKVPWSLVLPASLSSELVTHNLKEAGFFCTGTGVGMVVRLQDIELLLKSSPLQFRFMQNSLETWSIPLIYGFESTPEMKAVYTARHEEALKKEATLYHLSGFLDDQIVCSLTLSLCENYARIDDVATMPDFQKRGFGSALIHEALFQARKMRVTYCFLEASESGLNVYKRAGFQEILLNHYYEKHSK